LLRNQASRSAPSEGLSPSANEGINDDDEAARLVRDSFMPQLEKVAGFVRVAHSAFDIGPQPAS